MTARIVQVAPDVIVALPQPTKKVVDRGSLGCEPTRLDTLHWRTSCPFRFQNEMTAAYCWVAPLE